jgi:tetratricopeptide (TPR) repeat protein
MLWQHRVDITEDERARWQVHLDQGLALQEQGQLEAACAEYDTAMAIDDHPANLLYQRARCLLELGRNEEALEGFLAAGDNCYTRTAANRRINGIIGNLAEEDPNDAVFLVDTEQALRDASPEGIPGAGQFFDHMHLTYEATFTIVTAVAKAILSQVGSGDPAGLYSLDESRVPMAFTLGEELRQLETAEPWVLKSHEPYSKAYLAERKNELRAQISTQGDTPLPDGPDLMPRQDFWLLRNALVTRLMNEARYEEALEHCQRLVSKYPAVWGFWQRLILTQLYAGHRDKAVEEARAATRTYPSYSASWTQLGLALMDASGSLDEAVAAYGMAVTLSPGNRPVLESYARTLAAAGRFEECLEALEEAPADIAFDRTQRALILRHGLEQCAGSGDCPTAARGLDVLLALDSNFEHVRPLLAMCGNAHDRAAMLEACRRHNVAIPPEFVSQP